MFKWEHLGSLSVYGISDIQTGKITVTYMSRQTRLMFNGECHWILEDKNNDMHYSNEGKRHPNSEINSYY